MSSELDSFDPTDKQAEIIRTVFKAADRGELISVDGLKASLSYGPKVTKAAITCSLRILMNKNVIEMTDETGAKSYKRGDKGYIKPTSAAYSRFRHGY